MSSESLLRALQLVMLGEVVYPTHVASLLIANANSERPQPERAQPANNELSKREVQILRCLLAGQSNKAIARNLHITESTVKMHFKNVMRKINAQNRTQAACGRSKTVCRRWRPSKEFVPSPGTGENLHRWTAGRR
ncbi:response regulator transcription factor [Azospirillum brasilense]|uniref:response regulator transcription factor n=1 Tax=Azospirillum brasilense TaxID=192 RepID=UPI0032B778AC